jgi:urease accessory protein
MELIHEALANPPSGLEVRKIPVDRLMLAKRRWRGVAEDRREFGFDLERPLADGAAVFVNDDATYVIAQKYEPVLEVALGEDSPTAARLGWIIGNLHFAIEVAGPVVRVVDDPAVRQLFVREGVAFTPCKRVFHPISGGHSHSH